MPTLRFSSFPDAPPEKAVIDGGPALAVGVEPDADLAVVGARLARLNSPDRRRKGNDGAVVHRGAGAGCGVDVVGGRRRAVGYRCGVVVLAVPCSMTVATISIEPFDGTVAAVANSVITLPVGASSGTLSQEREESVTERPARTASRSRRRRTRYVERVVVA